jgi:glycosyltransferase involved in cell wall biosynthesis
MRFHFGITDRKRIYDLYKSASIFINTSTVEGLPLSLLEAMKCGCYPICPDIGGISGKLAEIGTLLPRDSQANAYAKMIRVFTSLPAEEKEALRNSVKKAVEKHSFKQMVSEITEAWMC